MDDDRRGGRDHEEDGCDPPAQVPPVGLEPTQSPVKSRVLYQLSYGGTQSLGRYGSATNGPRKLRADAVSMRESTFVERQNVPPVIVVPATMFVSVESAPRKFGPPESPADYAAGSVNQNSLPSPTRDSTPIEPP